MLKMKRATVMLVTSLMLVDVGDGFSFRPQCPMIQHHTSLFTDSVKQPLWHPHSLKTKNAFRTSLAVRAAQSDNPADDNDSNTTDALHQMWTDVKYGACYVNDNYLSLLGYNAIRVFWVMNIVWLAIGFAFSLSPIMGSWTVRLILTAFQLLSQSALLYFLPIIIILGVALGVLLSVFTILENMAIPRAIANVSSVASFLQFCKKLVQQVMNRFSVEDAKTTSTPQMFQMLERSGGFVFMLRLCILAPIGEELQYRLMFDRINRWFTSMLTMKSAHVSDQSASESRDSSRLSTRVGSFIFACAHLGNWLSPSLDVSALVDSNVKMAIAVLSMGVVQGTGAFNISERVLFPVYQKRGVAASIGAHATWNTLFVTNVLHVPFRVLVRLRKCIQRGRSE